MIKANIVKEVEIDELKIEKILKRITKCVKRLEKIRGPHVVSFIIVNEDRIWEINKQYRNIDKPTDVISFAEIDSDENHVLPLEMGDIFICKEKVFSQALEYGHSVEREFAFLATHGLYHLLGYDHQTEEDEKVMFEKQENVLTKLKIGR
jgi:probable rRNA maturation factor